MIDCCTAMINTYTYTKGNKMRKTHFTKVLKKIDSVIDFFATIKTASYLARQGNHIAAKALFTNKNKEPQCSQC